MTLRECGCVSDDAYDCFAARYYVRLNWNGEQLKQKVRDVGGPCECACHNDEELADEDDVHEWESADRFRMWAGQGLPVSWARAMSVETAVVYPITDSASCGVIDGGPKPEQVLCWCPSREKAVFVIDALRRKEHDMDIRRR